MLKQVDAAKVKWGGYHSLIDRWLDARQQLLINFCGMFKTGDMKNLQTLPDGEVLTDFCQQLMDYVSLGHFEVYESLVANCHVQGDASLSLARGLYPEISKTTDIALVFNDKYTNINNVDKYDVLSDDLSRMGVALAERFELEDQLIEAFHTNH